MTTASRQKVEAVRNLVRGERFVDLVVALGGHIKRRKPNAARVELPCFLHGGSGHELGLKPADGLWTCRAGCGGGDAIELVERARNCDFTSALKWLAEWSGGAPLALVPPPREVRRVDASPLTRAVWDIVRPLPLTAIAVRYLESRGIDPDVAHALGCRDWSSKLGAIREACIAHGADMIESAGLGEPDHRGTGQWWWPLRPQNAAPAGLAIPVWQPHEDAPARWRWRLFEPFTPAQGGTLKTISTYSNGACVDLIGARRPEREEGSALAYTRPRTLLIVEGEPDWLSATQVADGRALVVGVCGGASHWRDVWPSFQGFVQRGIERVVVCVHRGKGLPVCPACTRVNKPKAERCSVTGCGASLANAARKHHGEVLAESVTWAATAAGIGEVKMRLPEEDCDLNDLHRAGRLDRFLARVL